MKEVKAKEIKKGKFYFIDKVFVGTIAKEEKFAKIYFMSLEDPKQWGYDSDDAVKFRSFQFYIYEDNSLKYDKKSEMVIADNYTKDQVVYEITEAEFMRVAIRGYQVNCNNSINKLKELKTKIVGNV